MFKKIIKKLLSSRYVRAGKCKMCGTCCRQITFKHENEFITDLKVFESLQKWQSRYKNFFVSGMDEEGVLLFTCKSLGDDNRCKVHFFRSWFCRAYPFVKTDLIARGKQTLQNCGFYYKPSVPFKDFLD